MFSSLANIFSLFIQATAAGISLLVSIVSFVLILAATLAYIIPLGVVVAVLLTIVAALFGAL